jgi:hypothetical protein
MAENVTQWHVGPVSWVQSSASPCQIYDGQSGTETSFTPNTSVFLFVLFLQCSMQCAVPVASAAHSEQPMAFLNNTVTAKWHAISTTVRVV